jgi:RNA polymerase sigma-70 factor (ECF subfamily)
MDMQADRPATQTQSPQVSCGISEAQWTAWVDACGPRLMLFVRQWTQCPAEAEDIVQEAFMRLWRSADATMREPLPLLFRCARQVAVDRFRSRVRRERREEVAGRERPDMECFALPEEDAGHGAEVAQALASLPEEQREVVVMKIWGELTFEQIAEVIGIPRNTAASRYRYALRALREAMKQKVAP